MRRTLLAAIVLVAMSPVWARAESVAATTQPTDSSALEVRAFQAVARGEFAAALPLLKKLEATLVDDADRLGQVREQIRVCERNLQNNPAAQLVAATGVDDIPTSPESRQSHAAPKEGEVLELDIKQLGNFEYDAEQGGSIPDDVRRLSGSRFRTRGFMIPMDQADNVTNFALVVDLFACCFGQPPGVQHMVTVRCPKGKSVNYFPDEIVVEGVLKVDEKKEEGYVVSLFEIDATSVKPAPK